MPAEETLTVRDRRAAAFLVDSTSRRFLDPFLNRDCTVARAAQELGEDKNTTLYRVRQMLRLDLLRVVREEPRRGRPVKVYRSVASKLFVPYSATPATDLLEVLLQDRTASERALQLAMLSVMRSVRHDDSWGMLLSRNGDSVFGYDAVNPQEAWHALEPHEPAVLDYTLTTGPLTHAQAKVLQRELLDVLVRHTRSANDPAGRPYLVRIALAPQPTEET